MSLTQSVPMREMYVDGAWVASDAHAPIECRSPATGEVNYLIQDASSSDVDRAVGAARRAFVQWSAMPPSERAAILHRVGVECVAHAERLAASETADNGKLLRDTLPAYRALGSIWQYFAGWADKFTGSVIPTAPTALTYVRREPVGVVAAIVPWNAPLQLASHKLGAALAMGNTVVLKPSEVTSGVVLDFVEVLERAGLPAGVVNVVTGYGSTAGAALVNHPGVDLITFTGGTETGKAIAKAAADRHVRVLLELGGKSPNIVFDDCDLDRAVEGVLRGIFAVNGQACTAGSRALVHRGIYDEFMERLLARTAELRIGDPRDAQTDIGPMAYEAHLTRVLDHIEVAVGEGARLRAGGRRPAADALAGGCYLEPTVFEGVTPSMRISREEVFGPVLAVMAFDSEDEVVELANSSEFALAAGVWTNDLTRAHRMAQRLDSGVVWINTYRQLSPTSPFGGFKASGHGKEGGIESLYEYTRSKTVWVELPAHAADAR